MASHVDLAATQYSDMTDQVRTSQLGTLYEAMWRSDSGYSRVVAVELTNNPQFSNVSPWSGPVRVNGLPGNGSIQSVVNYRIGNSLVQGYWRGNQGWVRNVPIVNGAVQWGSAPAFSGPISISGLHGSGDMQAHGDYAVGNTLIQAIWRNNQGWTRNVPIVNGVVQWSQPGPWNTNPININTMPGNGDMQAHGDYAVGNTLIQAIWRNNQGWTRTVLIVNGVVQWGQAGLWNTTPININTMPGSGDMQAQDNYVIGNTYWQVIWRSNVQWTRSVPIVAGVVRWDLRSEWVNTTANVNLPGSGAIQTQGNYMLSWSNNLSSMSHGEIEIIEQPITGYFGDILAGYTFPVSAAGQPCYWTQDDPTDQCNTTTMKASSSQAYFNSSVQYPDQRYLARHELGHVFGLFHPPCNGPLSVMFTGCAQTPISLQGDEVNWINANY